MKKKISALLLCGVLAVSLAACGSSDTAEEEHSVEESSKSTALLWDFESLAKEINEATMEEAKQSLDDTGVTYEVTEASDTEAGSITTEEDENGCHLYLAFGSGDGAEAALSTVTYGNDHFYGSVDDMAATGVPLYLIYNYEEDPAESEVANLNGVLEYFEMDLPGLLARDK